jgi:glycosyltransferase involved in cell wall biosynthesis
MKPLISFIICTYNSPDLIIKCINSILKQKYSGKKQILIIDGGSNQETLSLIKRYEKEHKDIEVIKNKEKLPEGYGKGKWLGWKKCKGEYVFIIDQDNELIDEKCVENMLIPFKKEKNILGCVCRLKLDKNDNLINQYVAIVGTDPFFAYKSLDYLINFIDYQKKEDYGLISINKDNIIITGGNCFVYNKKILDSVGGYIQDTENIQKLTKKGYNQVAITEKVFTHHSAIKGFFDFIRKKKRWAKVYKKNDENNFSYIPNNKHSRKDIIINLFFVFTILPILFISLKQTIKTKEKVWMFHPVMAFITGFIYLFYTFVKIVLKIR